MNIHEMSDCHLDLMDNKGRERFLINLNTHFKSKPVKTVVLAYA